MSQSASESIQEMIVAAIAEGFDQQVIVEPVSGDLEDWTRIYVTGFNEPIEVRPDDVVIPEEFGAIRSVIALDIQALLLFLPDEEEDR